MMKGRSLAVSREVVPPQNSYVNDKSVMLAAENAFNQRLMHLLIYHSLKIDHVLCLWLA